MTILFQLSVLALIVLSFLLVIGVPVVLASPDGWSTSKNTVFFWSFFVDWISFF